MSKSTVVIEEYEGIMAKLAAEGKPCWCVKDEDANRTMFKAYFDSKESGKERIDFSDVIWNTDVQPIADACRKFGITEFTISVRQGSLVDEILPAFQEFGVTIQRMVKVEVERPSFRGISEREVINAILMRVA